MREIVPGVLTWSRRSERHGYDFNGLLVRQADGNICIDPVEPAHADTEALTREGVARIVLTNRNHVRAANRVRAATGAPVAIHPADAAHARAEGATIDGSLAVGEVFGGLVVVGVPGKSVGEVALHWPARRLLIVGDAVIGHPAGACSLLPDRVMDDPAGLRTSVRALLALDFDALLVGDGAPILRGAKERLRELVVTFGS
jgi:glyoxylase-like metal-dependent hydrolase (beta-lactamase superfamily II)